MPPFMNPLSLSLLLLSLTCSLFYKMAWTHTHTHYIHAATFKGLQFHTTRRLIFQHCLPTHSLTLSLSLQRKLPLTQMHHKCAHEKGQATVSITSSKEVHQIKPDSKILTNSRHVLRLLTTEMHKQNAHTHTCTCTCTYVPVSINTCACTNFIKFILVVFTSNFEAPLRNLS